MGALRWAGGRSRSAALIGALMATTALTAVVASGEAAAQTSRADERGAVQQPGKTGLAQAAPAQRSFDIPAQPLADALTQFGRQSGMQVSVDAGLVRGISSPGVGGSMLPEQALQRLLAGTGIGYRLTGGDTAMLERLPTGGSGVMQLDPVMVEGKRVAPRQAEIGNLPPAYAGGQVARGGRVGMLGNRDIMDTPFNQTSYTQKTIQDQRARTLADVLNNDPSVRGDFPGGSGIDQATIRGFVAGNQDIAFGGLYGVAPTSNGMMAVESIERVEVLKGPNALLNGMAPFGSIGGAINLVPKRAGDRPMIQFTPSYYSDSQFGGHVDVGRRFGPDNNFGVRFNGVYRNGDTAIDRQSQETRVAALGLDFRDESVRLSADLGYQFQNTDGTRRPLSVAAGVLVPDTPDSSVNYSQPWTFAKNENTYGALRGEVDIVENVTVFAAAGGSLLRLKSVSEGLRVQDTQGTITGNPFGLRFHENASTVEMGLRGSIATWIVSHDFTLAGTFFRKESGSAFQSAAIPASNLYNPIFASEPSFTGLPDPGDAPKVSEQKLSSLALADTLSVLDERIQLTLGLRRQQVETDSFDRATGSPISSYDKKALTPAVGLVVRPLKYLTLYGNYIEGLSQGSVAPVGTANAGEIFPPFETTQYEAGIKIDFGSVATTLSAFQISQPSGFTDPATNIFGIDGEQRHRGLELNAFGEVVEGVRILGGVMMIDSELTKTADNANQGNDGIGAPSLQVNVGAEWDTPFLRGLTLSARAVYTSSQYLNAANTQEVPSWTRVDFGVRYSVEAGGTPITIRANLENAFDEGYWAAASRGSLGMGMPRTVLLSVTADF